MLRHYEVNLAGPSHRANGTPCQDACAVQVRGNTMVAAVADGLGSEQFSHVGSHVAARTAVTFCCDNLARCSSPERTLALLRDAFDAAYGAVLDKAADAALPAGQMDCTLCLVLWVDGVAAWGQSGDSGLAVSHADGSYSLITRMQRDDEGRVYPLCFADRWEFGICTDVASALLCTDGILEGLIAPPLLAKHAACPIDTRVARGFLHPTANSGSAVCALQRSAQRYVEGLPTHLVDDDKTTVVLFDDERLPNDMPAPYYDGPDWDALYAQAEKLIYPSSHTADAQAHAPADAPRAGTTFTPTAGSSLAALTHGDQPRLPPAR